MAKRKKKWIKWFKKWFWRLTIFFFASTIFVTVLYKFVNPPLTYLMLKRLAEQTAHSKPWKLEKDWVKIEDISMYMQVAVVASEDQKFLKHHGISFTAIKKARAYNKTHTHKRGASTISQQTAKNVFLWPKASWIRKGFEVYFTGLIELIWGKKRIMEVYLNVIETGDGIYGVEKAAQEYFHTSAKNLTKSQAALIAVCLPNPRKMSPAKRTPYRLKRQAWAMRQMKYFYPLDFTDGH